MREILFRGYSTAERMWIYGDLSHTTDKIVHISNENCFIGVKPETVGQYTGLTDKNGKKIFEGDICRFREWNTGDMCWIGKVSYKHQQFVINGGKNKECATPFTLVMSRFIPKNIEVIGNIHDNRLEDFEDGK